jgi:hypothetical protein
MSARLLLLTLAASAAVAAPDTPAWDALVKEFVTAESRVDYARLKRQGLARLDAYLASVAAPWPRDLSPAARTAALVNAYNALTVRWIVAHYPVASIWRTKKPFTAARHRVDGRAVSLDAIETELRSMGDPRIHAALVCAARSCPPLRREAYTTHRVEGQLDDNARAWLANPALNEFDAARRSAAVSSIFDWYGKDFGSVTAFLIRYAPAGKADFLRASGARITYKTYQWGLNDTSDLGRDYSEAKFLLDRAKNVF